MKYYPELVSLGCFSLEDLKSITGSSEAANALSRAYREKGYIQSVRKNLYVAISMETGQPVPTRYEIASHISEDAVVSYHSAFEYYGYANQVFYDVYITSLSRFHDFQFDGITYRRVSPKIISHIQQGPKGVRVSSLERTVIESIERFEKIGGLEELLRCLQLIPALDESQLLSCLEEYDNGFLYQKTGLILSAFAQSLQLSSSFFENCRKYLPTGKSYLYNRSKDFVFHKNWNIYAPADVLTLIAKGVTDYDAI
ncbi:MAG: transcriptional regulator [Spirochaetales bacterium]|nr:transcriptional regulator [Spirochaetales bacterium]